MPKTIVQCGSDLVGEFEFTVLPRKGEDISVPSTSDPTGVRVFEVDAVQHMASGLNDIDFGGGPIGDGPLTLLMVSEIH